MSEENKKIDDKNILPLGEEGRKPQAKKAVSHDDRGISYLKKQLLILPSSSGCYRMLNILGEVLYVGKAKNIRKRVASYTNMNRLPVRLQRMVSETVELVVVTTHTEAEALLLEANLIKKLKPRYNVLLRDDKSFSLLHLDGEHDFPILNKHRGAKKAKGDYFGPFASAGAVNRTLAALQKAFMLRNCSDSIFKSRSRPCLQYQIKRCTAPCVGFVDKDEYKSQVDMVRDFLSGKSREIQDKMAAEMMAASQKLDYEKAAIYRDRIKALTSIQAHQTVGISSVNDADIMAIYMEGGRAAIQIFFYRNGQNYGTFTDFPRHDKSMEETEILEAFIGQFYRKSPPPPLILLNKEVLGKSVLEEALAIEAGRKVEIIIPQRGDKFKAVKQAEQNAKEALSRRMAGLLSQKKWLSALQELLNMKNPINRIEIYDNSHIQGTDQTGAMVVANREGFDKKSYRKFNIKGKGIKGDDFAMMREVLTRRFKRALKEDEARKTGSLPDILLIDGGKGQLSATYEVMVRLGVDDIKLVAISKGVDRNAGREILHQIGKSEIRLEKDDQLLYFLQRLRDESHRFAIGSHRARRKAKIGKSILDEVSGIGAKRKKALLLYFGSAKEVAAAGIEDLAKVEGISKVQAQRIYDHFH